MTTRSELDEIEILRYVADVFRGRLSPGDASGKHFKAAELRTLRLIANALEGLPNVDWEISGTSYRSAVVHEPYGIESDGAMTYVYGEERGRKWPMAIFKSSSLAAEYFVWIVSDGTRKIDWELYLDMVHPSAFEWWRVKNWFK